MTPGEIRGSTLAELRRVRRNMMSADWLKAVEELPEAERAMAATALLDVCLAIRRLESARVADIREELAGNERELRRGLDRLEVSGERLHRFRTYLKAATSLVAAVGKVFKPL